MAITIPSELKRDHLLNSAMRAFKNRLLPSLTFAKKFESIPLEGTDVIRVPYFPLATGTATAFNPANGYNTETDYTIQTKPVTVNKRPYKMLGFTSAEVNRQPFLSLEQIITHQAEKLADEVLADIWSVVTATNFPGTTLAAMAATAFDLDDVLALRELCHKDNWPKSGRSLILDSSFGLNLTKDSRLGNQNSGSTSQVRAGFPDYEVGGFNVFEVANLPANSAEKIAGAAVYPSAIFVAFSPITPVAKLTQTLLEYKVITDPDTGLSLEYRSWGDAKMDKVYEVIECNYGYSVGESAALKRITTP